VNYVALFLNRALIYQPINQPPVFDNFFFCLPFFFLCAANFGELNICDTGCRERADPGNSGHLQRSSRLSRLLAAAALRITLSISTVCLVFWLIFSIMGVIVKQ